MSEPPFPQLRVRTEFSFRDGRNIQTFAPVGRLAAALADMECPAAGIVDAAGTWGHVKWSKALEKHAVAPLFGREFTVAQEDGRRPKAWALGEDMAAFYRMSTAACQEGADIRALFRESRGLIRFAGTALTDPDEFDYVDVNPASPLAQRDALRLAQRTGKPLVITCDNAYARKEDYAAFMAISGGRAKVTPQHLLSLEELRAQLRVLDDATFAAAVSNTWEAAGRAQRTLSRAPMIHFPGDLRALAAAGKEHRLARGHIAAWTDVYEQRMERELAAIASKGFESYFFVVADMIAWAKQRMLVGPGRGSSAGSLVCYLLGITEVDPLPHNLLFERFIDLTRADLPDIDVDFSDRKRDLVFDYLSEKYGRACVARIGNINTMKPRTVMGKIGEVFGIPSSDVFGLLNVLVEYSSGDSRYGKSLEDTLTLTELGRQFTKKYPEAALMGDIENHATHTGVHAAGVIVSNVPVSDFCTVGAEGVAQLDKPDSEFLNLLKIDALGLSTLGVIEDAGVVTGEELYALKLDEPAVFKVFNDRKFAGIFQFEGSSQRSITAQIEIRSFQEIDHVTALARPGPLGGGATGKYIERHAGRAAVEYSHPLLEPITKHTYGVVLYQETTMQIVREIGGFSWEDTSFIRKAMSGRKGNEYFAKKKVEFINGAVERGMDEDIARSVWDELASMGSWTMNRCTHKDTRVKLAHPTKGTGSFPTIEELYLTYKEKPSRWIRQRKVMPVLLCVGPDGVARPRMAKDIHKTGKKPCLRLEFHNGDFVECTADHKFIICGNWMRCGDAALGAEFSSVARVRQFYKPTGEGRGWMAGRAWEEGQRPRKNGKFTAQTAFKKANKNNPCEDCGCAAQGRMEAHHNDFAHGEDRPEDLSWLCNSCHKQRHIDNGTRREPYAHGHWPDEPRILVRVTDIGVHETYDIEMPAPDHNYVLANGVITHNSHTCAYAVIAYWTAWMKVHHPVAYAAACLRHADDEDKVLALLREIVAEGVSYVAFDAERSDVDWAVVDGELVGGYRNLVGFGPANAVAAVEARRTGTMDEKLRAKIAKAKVKFQELRPLYAEFCAIYDDPTTVGAREGSRVCTAETLPEKGDCLYIGRIQKKEMRDENETVRVARRGGQRKDGPTLFADFFLKDDTGVPVIVRVPPVERRAQWGAREKTAAGFEPLGRLGLERLQEGDVLLVRGNRIPKFPMIQVLRMKCLNREVNLTDAVP